MRPKVSKEVFVCCCRWQKQTIENGKPFGGAMGQSPISKMLRHLFLEMFSLSLRAPALSANERIDEFLDFAIQAKFAYVQLLSKKRMLHKTRARNARPYGYGGIMRNYFFPQHCRGAHRAPVIGICAKFRICSFTVCQQAKESPAGTPGIL